MDILIVVIVLLGSFVIGIPIAYGLGLAALFAAFQMDIPYEAIMLQISHGVSKFAMLTIPFFVLAGAIMAEGGMARRLVAFADVLVGIVRVRGGLSVVNIVATSFLSGISGSSVADTSAIGSVMIPQMEKVGFPFMAGIVPGLLLAVSLIILVLIIGYRDKHPRGVAVPLRDAGKIIIEAIWGLMTLVIILGGILGGIFTAIEAGAVACVYAFIVTMFVYRDYKWRDLPLLIHRTMKTVAMVMTLIAFAAAVGYMMALMQVPAKITGFFLSMSSDKHVILFMINILLLVLGCLIDMAPNILICTPILLPVMANFGVDPVHFGMIMMLNLGIGLCHPPVGSIIFVGCAVGKVTMEQVVAKMIPFYGVMFIVLMLVTYFPEISLWLPHRLGL